MKNIEEFIDNLFLERKTQDINSLITETINKGNASELITFISLINGLRSVYKGKNTPVFIDRNSITVDEAKEEALKFLENSSSEYDILKKESDSFVSELLSSTYFKLEYLEEDNEDISLKRIYVNFTGTSLSGLSSADLSVKFLFTDSDNQSLEKNFRISLKRGNLKIYGASRFRPRKVRSLEPKKDELPKTVSAELVKEKGQGPTRLFSIFGHTIDSDIEQNLISINKNLYKIYSKFEEDSEKDILSHSDEYNSLMQKRNNLISSLYENFSNFLKSEVESANNSEKIANIINVFYNLITRSDDFVGAYADLKKSKKILFTPLMNRYANHIKKLDISFERKEKSYNDEDGETFSSSLKNPHISIIIPYDGINLFGNFKLDKTIHKEIYLDLQKIIDKSTSLVSNTMSVKHKRQYQYLQAFFNTTGLSGVTKLNAKNQEDLNKLFYAIVDKTNSILKSIQNVKIFDISYSLRFYPLAYVIAKKREENEKILKKYNSSNQSISFQDFKTKEISAKISSEEDEETENPTGHALFSVGGSQFENYITTLNNLYELEKNPNSEVRELLKLIEKILINADLKELEIQENKIIDNLILEALNQKEYSKVIKKVNNSGAKGLVSAIPSNKTANTIAVRFDNKDSIAGGIKKVKSTLRSQGYELEDKRVLKFDQDNDTTDVIKNGEVVARLFFRADIKERKGLAYEHIIGAVLTKKITSQLKNRIDLPPDASKDEVMKKLKSEEFDKLFQSAKKAAPLIIQKVGNIVSAESVGSTNNKADFVLKTDTGKTIGLSAKYAAGEKDNEYKMNKVLGFGTEEDSLVRNPNGTPWWIVGRKTFLKKLKSQTKSFGGREYDPDPEDLDAPAWMKTAKESNPDIYKETMEEVYGTIRNILASNLKKLGLKGLISFVNEADLGKEEERENYDNFLKVMDGPSGLSVTEINIEGVKTDGLEQSINLDQVVVQDRSDIIIKIPGHNELKINSVKFKSDMLSSKAGDLKIKTR